MSIPPTHLAQEAIAALVDGELPAGPASRAARHLTGCLQCQLAVEAQREAKEALHASADVAVPGELMSRLCAIPFTTDVPGAGGGDTLAAGPGDLTVSGATGAFSVDLRPPRRSGRAEHARWLRRGIAGTLLGLGASVAVLALNLPGDAAPGRAPSGTVAEPSVAEPSVTAERTDVAQPVVRSVTVGTSTPTNPDGTP